MRMGLCGRQPANFSRLELLTPSLRLVVPVSIDSHEKQATPQAKRTTAQGAPSRESNEAATPSVPAAKDIQYYVEEPAGGSWFLLSTPLWWPCHGLYGQVITGHVIPTTSIVFHLYEGRGERIVDERSNAKLFSVDSMVSGSSQIRSKLLRREQGTR